MAEPPPPLIGSFRRGAVAAALVALSALGFAARAGADELLCSMATYTKSWYERPCPWWPDPSGEGCLLAQAFYCANDQPYLGTGPGCAYEGCPLGVGEQYATTTECTDPLIGTSEVCGDGVDNDANGCAEDGCTQGEAPCDCVKQCEVLACGAVAGCNPITERVELCSNGTDDDCDGMRDEGCAVPGPTGPPPTDDRGCDGSPGPEPEQPLDYKGGQDPLLLASGARVTNPFTDFAASAISTLSFSRTWNGNDASMVWFGASHGPFGRGWHHDWEGEVFCESETTCVVMRGPWGSTAFNRSGSALSLDGSETLELWRPQGASGAARRQLLVRRPSGEWSLHQPDGSVLRFATACGGLRSDSLYCRPALQGGRDRLVAVADRAGNEVRLDYSWDEGLLLGITDGLGHRLELRGDCSSGVCLNRARELRYDGMVVARYGWEEAALSSVSDGDGAVMQSYSPGMIRLLDNLNPLFSVVGAPVLAGVTKVHDESGAAIVEFGYQGQFGIVDEATTLTAEYVWHGEVDVTEYFGTTSSTCRRSFDDKGKLLAVGPGCSSGEERTFTYSGEDLVCTRDTLGNVTYDGRDGLGRVTRHARYQGATCPPGALSGTFEEEWRAYGVRKPIAQGVNLELDHVTQVSRMSGLASGKKATREWDYDPAPKAIDPLDYACTEAPLPAGAVLCRYVETGYVTVGTSVLSERHATFYSYDGRGRVTQVIGPVNLDRSSASDVVPVEQRVYWPDGESLARRGRLAEVRRWASVTAVPMATTYDYDAFGLYRRWEPDGSFTTWVKDGRGRARWVLRSDGRTTETRYHDGEKPRLRIGPAGEVERTGYDERGRVVSRERLSGDPDVAGASVTVLWGEYTQYDPAGNPIRSERRDETGGVVWKQEREFDVRHRLVRETHPEVPGAARSWEFDASGFLTRAVDEEARETVFTPEYIGRVKAVTKKGVDAGGAPVSLAVATYGYQQYTGALGTVKDGKGLTTTYRYDDFGRLEQLIQPNFKAGALQSTWDARGNLLKQKDFYNRLTVSYTWDGLDRPLTGTATNVVDGATVTYAYAYDEGGAMGRLTSVVEPERTVRFGYDGAGRLVTEGLEEAGVAAALVTEYRRDGTGRMTEVVYPTGLRLAYDRDPVSGEVRALRNAVTGEVYAGGIERLAAGPVTSLHLSNGTSLAQGFNARWEPTSVWSGPVGLAYTPTPAGDVGQVEEDGLALPFRYDFLDRLWESSGWFSYGHDGNGNRTSEWVEGTSVAWSYTNDRVKDGSTPGATPVKRWAFAYDAQASVTGIGRYNAAGTAVEAATCLRHDPLGRVVTVGPAKYPSSVTPDATYCTLDTQLASVTARFKYDFRSRRVAAWRVETGQWVYTVFDAAGQPLAELALTSDPANPWRPVREYVWLDGKPVAQIEHDAATGAARTYAVHADAIGMPRALTSPGGAVVWRASVPRPYGDIVETSVPDPATGRTVVTNLRLPGQYDERLLASVGMQGPYYNWNRWYLPSVGRYLELDPIAKRGGFNGFYGPNWYGYAEGNPLRWTDPEGLTWSGNLGFLWDWLWGGGDTRRSYCGSDFQTSEMKDSFGVSEFRERFYGGGCNTVKNFCFGTFDAFIWTLDTPSSTAFQVGGFCGSATRNGDSVTYRIRNEAGTKSFFYHLAPNRSGDCGPMRTIYQTFEWTEPVNNCACGKCVCD